MTALGGRFSADLRRQLSVLEKARKPSQWDRGALSALRLHAVQADDVRRIEALTEKWRAVR